MAVLSVIDVMESLVNLLTHLSDVLISESHSQIIPCHGHSIVTIVVL